MTKWLVVYEGGHGDPLNETIESNEWSIHEGIIYVGAEFAIPYGRLISIKKLLDLPQAAFLDGGVVPAGTARWVDEGGCAYVWPDRDGEALPAPE